jgi:hypothetical protein
LRRSACCVSVLPSNAASKGEKVCMRTITNTFERISEIRERIDSARDYVAQTEEALMQRKVLEFNRQLERTHREVVMAANLLGLMLHHEE